MSKLSEAAKNIIAGVKARLGDHKVSLSAAWTIIQGTIAEVVLLIEREVGTSLSGPDKKAAAMAVISNVIDVVVVAVDIPFIPEIIEQQLDVVIKKILLIIASGSIDAIVTTFRVTGVISNTTTTPWTNTTMGPSVTSEPKVNL